MSMTAVIEGDTMTLLPVAGRQRKISWQAGNALPVFCHGGAHPSARPNEVMATSVRNRLRRVRAPAGSAYGQHADWCAHAEIMAWRGHLSIDS